MKVLGTKYLTEQLPWKEITRDHGNVSATSLRCIAFCVGPFKRSYSCLVRSLMPSTFISELRPFYWSSRSIKVPYGTVTERDQSSNCQRALVRVGYFFFSEWVDVAATSLPASWLYRSTYKAMYPIRLSWNCRHDGVHALLYRMTQNWPCWVNFAQTLTT